METCGIALRLPLFSLSPRFNCLRMAQLECSRNLQTRVTFMLLELEDLFIVLGAAAIMNVLGHFVGGEIAGMPTNIVLQYGVPLLMVPVLMAFKYGKPRGYVRDLAFWYAKPRAYCALARDREIRTPYLREE